MKMISSPIFSPRWRRRVCAVAGAVRFRFSHSLLPDLQILVRVSSIIPLSIVPANPHFQSHSFSTRQIPKSSLKSTIQSTDKPSTNSPEDEFSESSVIESLSGYNNDYKRALEFFQWLETGGHFRHTTDTYNRMIDILEVIRGCENEQQPGMKCKGVRLSVREKNVEQIDRGELDLSVKWQEIHDELEEIRKKLLKNLGN